MKLKNKLLPLVGVGAACAAVTPIALTSCTTGGMVDLLGKYETQINDIPGVASLSEEEANTVYFQAVKRNPAVFADDIYWYRNDANKYVYSNKNAGKRHASPGMGLGVGYSLAPDKLIAAVGVSAQLQKDGPVYIYNTTKDDEKIVLTSIKKESVQPIEGGDSYDVWLASFTEEFDTTYDETMNYIVDGEIEYTEYATVSNTGKIEFNNIPLMVEFSYNGSSCFGKTTYSTFEDALWQIKLDDRIYGKDSENNDLYLIDYIIDSEEYDSNIKVNATSSKTQVDEIEAEQTEETITKTVYSFEINSDFDFMTAYYSDAYRKICSQMASLGFSHYLWNLDLE